MRKLVITTLLLSGSLCFSDTLITSDGARHSGTLQSATAHSVAFKEGVTTHRYLRSDIQSIEFDNEIASDHSAAALSSSKARYATGNDGARSAVTLPAGTEVAVLTNDNIDSATASEGQTFSADVAENVTNSAGRSVIPKGSEAELVLRRVQAQGKVTGSSELVLDLQSVKVNGHRYTISTEDVAQKGNEGIGSNKRTAVMVGGGAVLGTLIGAVAGGGKGAAIGAATGAAAGAGTEVLTRGKAVKVPAETKLRFRLDQPLRFVPAY